MRRIWWVLLALFSFAQLAVGDEAPERFNKGRFFDGRSQLPRIEKRIQQVKMAEDSDKALDTIVKLSVKMMRDQKLNKEADEVERDWRQLAGFITKKFRGDKDVGDYAPWSLKLQALYQKIEDALGEEICHWARLDDIKSINHSVVVVLRLDALGDADIDLHEYGLHWDGKESVKYNLGLAGTVAYWTTYGVCVGVTWGMGAVTFICMPAGMVAERATEQWIAPKYREKLYQRFYGI